ncbi:MAG: hypothetical protein OXH31_08470 [Gammaproteobacteria bacterium]|nr:hypothetical protein [Gammaproteobacteria bacterium]
MIETILGILLIFVLAPSNGVTPDLVVETQHSPEHLELEVEQDEQSEGDCRYTEASIPHRDLSDYVVLEEISIKSNDELNDEQSEVAEHMDFENMEEVQDKLELKRSNEEEKD